MTHKNWKDLTKTQIFNIAREAIEDDALNILKVCIKNGMDIDITDDEYGYTLLSLASRVNSKFVDVLLKAGANPNIKDKSGVVAAVYSIGFKKEGAFRLLMEAGTNINDLFPFEEETYYTRFYHEPYVLQYMDTHLDQLTPENLLLWKSLRLKFLFKQIKKE